MGGMFSSTAASGQQAVQQTEQAAKKSCITTSRVATVALGVILAAALAVGIAYGVNNGVTHTAFISGMSVAGAALIAMVIKTCVERRAEAPKELEQAPQQT